MTDRNYDPELREILPLLPTITDLGNLESIQEMRDSRENLFGEPVDRDDVLKEDRRVPGPEGAPEVAVRIYRKKSGGGGARACVFEIHGGGFLLGSIDMMDAWCQRVAAELDAVVVSVEYRLAPEHPFPAGVEDCYAALAWTAAQADTIGVDPERIAARICHFS